MHPQTGHLVSPYIADELRESLSKGYVQVPDKLNKSAKRKLNGKKEIHIRLNNDSGLARFAAAQRKAKRKMQKLSRRKNR